MMAAFIKALIVSCLILSSCMSRTEVKKDYKPYADTCESCYDTLSHMHIYIKNHNIPPQRTGLDSIKAYIKLHDSIRTSVKGLYVKSAKEALELAKKEEDLTQMFVFEEHLYIAYRFTTFADRKLCDSIRLHYAEEMLMTAIKMEDTDTIGIAISHYMTAMRENRKVADMKKILNRVGKIESFREAPYKYGKVLCLISRKYSAEGDSIQAREYLKAAIVTGIKGGADGVEVVGRRAAQQLLDKGNVREAAQAYYSVLQMNDSVMKEKSSVTKKRQEADEVYINNMLLWCILFLFVICGILTFYYFRNKRNAEEQAFESEITTLQETTSEYEQTLQKLEKAEIENRAEIADMKKTIDKLKNTIVERISRGKAIYEKLQKGNCQPDDLKGAEDYLIDYYLIFVPEKYNKWNKEFEGLTPRMYTYLILLDMNYSDSDIQRILGISASSLRSLRSRTMGRRGKTTYGS